MALPRKGIAYDFYITLVSIADPVVFQSAPTLAAGDFKISKDGGAFINLATLPVVLPLGNRMVKVVLSATEMDADKVNVLGVDVAGDEWQEVAYMIDIPINTVDQVSGKVWDELTTDHTTAGTFGKKLLQFLKWFGLK